MFESFALAKCEKNPALSSPRGLIVVGNKGAYLCFVAELADVEAVTKAVDAYKKSAFARETFEIYRLGFQDWFMSNEVYLISDQNAVMSWNQK